MMRDFLLGPDSGTRERRRLFAQVEADPDDGACARDDFKSD